MNLLNYFNTFDGLPDNVDNCTLGVGGAADRLPRRGHAGRVRPPVAQDRGRHPGDGPGRARRQSRSRTTATAPTAPCSTWWTSSTRPPPPAPMPSSTWTPTPARSTPWAPTPSRSGMIYKPAKVTPVGQTAALNTAAFVNGGDSAPRNRPALAQAFQQNSNRRGLHRGCQPPQEQRLRL